MEHPFVHYLVRALITVACAYAGYLISVLPFGQLKLAHPARMFKVIVGVATGCSRFGTALVIESALCCVLIVFKDVSQFWFLIPALFFGSYQWVFTGIWVSGISWWGLYRLFVFVAPFLGLVPLWFLLA